MQRTATHTALGLERLTLLTYSFKQTARKDPISTITYISSLLRFQNRD